MSVTRLLERLKRVRLVRARSAVRLLTELLNKYRRLRLVAHCKPDKSTIPWSETLREVNSSKSTLVRSPPVLPNAPLMLFESAASGMAKLGSGKRTWVMMCVLVLRPPGASITVKVFVTMPAVAGVTVSVRSLFVPPRERPELGITP